MNTSPPLRGRSSRQFRRAELNISAWRLQRLIDVGLQRTRDHLDSVDVENLPIGLRELNGASEVPTGAVESAGGPTD